VYASIFSYVDTALCKHRDTFYIIDDTRVQETHDPELKVRNLNVSGKCLVVTLEIFFLLFYLDFGLGILMQGIICSKMYTNKN